MEQSESTIVSTPLLREELVVLLPKDAYLLFLNARDALLNIPLVLATHTHSLRKIFEHKLRMMNIFTDPTIEVDSYCKKQSCCEQFFTISCNFGRCS